MGPRFAKALLLVLPMGAGCSLLNDVSDLEGSARDAGLDGNLKGAAVDGASCSVQIVASPNTMCQRIPVFAGVQTVDGLGDDFCQTVVATEFDEATGARDPQYPAAPAPVVGHVIAQPAWTPSHFVMFAHVVQPIVAPPSDTLPISDGDGLEVYVSTSAALTGPYGPGADSAVQFIVVPPSTTLPARAIVATTVNGSRPLLPAYFASRRVEDGYTVELRVPWAELSAAAPPPNEGDAIGFDIAVNVRLGADAGRPGSGGRYQGIYNLREPGSDAGTCVGMVSRVPWCDDRTWCTPKINVE
jgi:hypothetical protein